ncbi:patatin-like phospholipase family protein [Phenylobacterium sp.]|jgi:predicted acylesterase/phospholipase RssA|uniref:patatin-like phospholipase family protein n=1 Tax=Phenylobacterium sp. TaxID=1871053 RepID=UPI002F944273
MALKTAWPRRRRNPPPAGVAAQPPGFTGVRLAVEDDIEGLTSFFSATPPQQADGTERLRILALSGGGAGGAYGAGALAGLTRAGARPVFDMVTGVSTGALIAPFAFVGPDWDDRLADAYTGGAPEFLDLTSYRRGQALYPSDRLAALVRRYIDADMLAAVAQTHAAGRRLFVATANLDAQTTSIWNMGAIASHGGDAALTLFTDVLVASASLPGVFRPKIIATAAGEETYDEMHVDGGAISPLFVVPEPMILRRAQHWNVAGVEVYALVNTTLHPYPKTTPVGALPVLVRSFELMLRSSYRGALRAVAAFCEINGFELRTASVPSDFGGMSMLRFDRTLMTRMYDKGLAMAEAGELWSAAP